MNNNKDSSPNVTGPCDIKRPESGRDLASKNRKMPDISANF